MSRGFEFVGFEFCEGRLREYLPTSEQADKKEQKRALFISMFNFYMPKELRLNKKEFNTKQTLLKIFTCKIESLMPISFTHKHKMIKNFRVDVVSSNIINNFLSFSHIAKGRFLTKSFTPNVKVYSKTPTLLLAKWIELIFRNNQFQMLFNLDDIFSNLVYERIKKVNRDKKVTCLHNGISILGVNGDSTSTFVIPSFSYFDTRKMHVKKEVLLAKEELKERRHNQIYFVYPKSDDFKRHIELKLPELPMSEDEYKVKLVPYSFSFCIKNKKGKEKCK